jgi:hypothetical protein
VEIVIDRKLTLAVVMAMGLEAASVLMWVGSANERLKEVELRVAGQSAMAERLARVEVHLQLQSAQLGRIEKKLER